MTVVKFFSMYVCKETIMPFMSLKKLTPQKLKVASTKLNLWEKDAQQLHRNQMLIYDFQVHCVQVQACCTFQAN